MTDEQGNEIVLNGELLDQSVYHYIVPADQGVLTHAIDLEVIRQQSQFSSESQAASETTWTVTHKDFCTKTMERDGYCVWTGLNGI